MLKKYIMAFRKMEQIALSGGQILIFGAGKAGIQLRDELEALGIEVVAFLDNYNENKTLCGKPIYRADYIKTLTSGTFFVMCAFIQDANYYRVRRQLEFLGLTEGESFSDFSVDCDKRFYREAYSAKDIPVDNYDLRQKHLLRVIGKWPKEFPPFDADTITTKAIDLKITTYCNRACKHCSHRIPHVKKPQHYDPDQIVADLDKVLGANVYVPYLILLGGEPLLHPELNKVFNNLAKMKNIDHIGRISLLTNSTVIPSDRALQAARELAKLTFVLNEYPYEASQSKLVELQTKLDEYGVSYRIAADTKYVWNDLGDPFTCRNRTHEELQHQRYVCRHASFILSDGKMYGCGAGGTGMQVGIIPERETDYVDVRSTIPCKELHKRLWELLYRTPYYNSCNYCDGIDCGAKEIPNGS